MKRTSNFMSRFCPHLDRLPGVPEDVSRRDFLEGAPQWFSARAGIPKGLIDWFFFANRR